MVVRSYGGTLAGALYSRVVGEPHQGAGGEYTSHERLGCDAAPI